jgi:type IV secretion system protein VirB1
MRNQRTFISSLSDPTQGVGGGRRDRVRSIHIRKLSTRPRATAAGQASNRDMPITNSRAFLSLVMILASLAPAFPAWAQTPLSLTTAARLAAVSAPEVNAGTLLAFAYYESRLRPFVIHDNTTGQSVVSASASSAAAVAATLLTRGHGLDLGIMQVNSANLARAGLTLTTAFDPGESMRAGAMILTAAYRQCLRGDLSPGQLGQQAALRCAASVYNTGREQAGILNGYQPGVWRAAAQIVPAIQFSGLRCNLN